MKLRKSRHGMQLLWYRTKKEHDAFMNNLEKRVEETGIGGGSAILEEASVEIDDAGGDVVRGGLRHRRGDRQLPGNE